MAGRIGTKASPPSEHMYGTPQEIAQRDKFTRQPDPTSFRQVPPDDNPGWSLAHATAKTRSGSMKFSKGV
jgi:hypothetical protein